MTNTKVIKIKDKTEQYENFSKTKLLHFLENLAFELDTEYISLEEIVNKVIDGLPDLISVKDLLELLAESIATKIIYHPDHSILAGRVEAVNLQKMTDYTFSSNVIRLRNYKSNKTGRSYGVVSDEYFKTVMEHKHVLDSIIDSRRDLELTYFGIKTLQNSYLLKLDNVVSETPQFMFLRVAIGIHGDDIDSVIETYELMSQKYFIHASPTLFNSGTEYNYLSSCFLLAMEDDSIDGIYKTLHKSALISKASGGIGLHVHNIRGSGSYIASSNGTSSGLVPMLRVFNNTARYVDQGGNKRPGAFAIYIEPWHCDIISILDLKKNHGKEEMRARDLFYGLWIPDLFMERVKQDLDWSLFSPDITPGLSDCYGDAFKTLYEKYEESGKAIRTIKAQKLWRAILECQTETGGPYMLFKDACNSKSNQRNLGTIKSSNLCCEIIEYSSPEETAVCNLGSLALPSFIKNSNELEYDFDKLHTVTKVLAKNLNKIIDITKYPIESAKFSNMRNRPIAVGVQGLADLFLELRLPFDSNQAKVLNTQIFETIYHAAVEVSIELAIKDGPYDTFKGSPISEGLFQFDLWNHKPSQLYSDWDELKLKAKTLGVRNSLLVAPMPTASTSQILGFNECFEPYTSNIYNRRVLSGEFQVVNKYLMKDLIDLGIWNSSMKNKIILENGSIQNIPSIPKELKQLYKTVWEISQKVIIELAADRGKFIDQSQSMNIHLQDPTFGKLTSSHFYAWEKGLKTGMYYLRTQAATRAIQFTVDLAESRKLDVQPEADMSTLKRKSYHEIDRIEGVQKKFKSEKPKMIDNTKKYKSDTYITPESAGIDSPETKGDTEESYDIYDTTPVACDINNVANCDSCSG
ncbi:DEHA2G23276p [Debaryomyces hansenii CBS767]|uniref:Ribonucleoside-diphosphate reductase n=1 Tax=Debaryomyces hansenii (strain ATCC 36239 / CBS 767 / BCRC 21394 / JCM 1990 / NBRC 0083 / IGC 2968) TaxID=284592 RepID=Q6BGW7_DEBHA|nr:DEHA2G23276p [Debaryomyces hansenii CBS767]CAG91065.2 DEHA2G23276p [Debaryomyces hansenii CBS767]|eukprot:XP_462554.2 DEHA2G23276p [Debaryomyces hansenii CBS767]